MLQETTPQAKPDKKPATVVEEYTDETTGHLVRRYENGMLYDMTTGRIARPPDREYRGIQSAEDARRLRQMQVDRAEEAIAKAIADKTKEHGKISPLAGPVEALAAAAGILWDEVVLNSRAKPRDRREVYETIGRDAGLRRDARENRDTGGPDAPQVLDVDALRAVVAQLREAKALIDGAKGQE